jgi:hypothetical protein
MKTMSIRSSLSAEVIRVRCAEIRSRWDEKTTAERRVTAAARQQQLAQRLGIDPQPKEDVGARLQICCAGAA